MCKPNPHLISATFSCSLTFSVGGNFVRTLSRDILSSPLLLSHLTAFPALHPITGNFPSFLLPQPPSPCSAAFLSRMFVLSPTSVPEELPLPVETPRLRLCCAFPSQPPALPQTMSALHCAPAFYLLTCALLAGVPLFLLRLCVPMIRVPQEGRRALSGVGAPLMQRPLPRPFLSVSAGRPRKLSPKSRV